MNHQTIKKIKNALIGIETQVEYIQELLVKISNDKDWLDTKEFAERTNLRPKTITNYAGNGVIKKTKRSGTGQYLIHVSELSKWTN
jgi:hypothetical protein